MSMGAVSRTRRGEPPGYTPLSMGQRQDRILQAAPRSSLYDFFLKPPNDTLAGADPPSPPSRLASSARAGADAPAPLSVA